MSSILTEIIDRKRVEIAAAKRTVSDSKIREAAKRASQLCQARNFGEALLVETGDEARNAVRIIAECKHKSPSRGILRDPYDPVALAKAYEAGGAAAISVLTDEVYFGGCLTDLKQVAEAVEIPVLRKDFIVDEYQIFEARAYGADSFLLLAGVLDQVQLQYFVEIGRELGMEPLIESHSLDELHLALSTDGVILGINNRDLNNFSVSLDTAKALVNVARGDLQPRLLVCESGIRNINDIREMGAIGFSAFLIGESLVTSQDPRHTLSALLSPP